MILPLAILANLYACEKFSGIGPPDDSRATGKVTPKTLNLVGGGTLSLDTNGLVTFRDAQGRDEIIATDGETFWEDSKKMSESGTVTTRKGYFVIKGDGMRTPLISPSDKHKHSDSAYHKTCSEGGRQFVVLQAIWGSPEAGKETGEIYVARFEIAEDAAKKKPILMDYSSIPNLREKSAESLVDDGVLKGFRSVDLRAYDAELTRPGRIPKQVKDDAGTMTNADQYVQTFVDPMSGNGAPISDPDLTEQVARGLRKSMPNVALTGDPGVGKSEFLERFVTAAKSGRIRDFPRTWQFWKVRPGALLAGTRYSGTSSARFNGLIEFSAMGNRILTIDEFHTLDGAGVTEGAPTPNTEIWNEPLGRGEMSILAISTRTQWGKFVERNRAFERRFVVAEKSAPTGEDLDLAVSSMAEQVGLRLLATRESTKIRNYIVIVTNSFDDKGGAQPARSKRLIDEIAGRRTYADLANFAVTREEIEAAAESLYRLPDGYFDRVTRRALLEGLANALAERVIIPDSTMERLVEPTYIAYAGPNDSAPPVRRFLLCGGPGVGKTELATAYAEALGFELVRISLANYGLASTRPLDDFLREIADALSKSVVGVILLDELDKARVDIQDTLLTAFDRGYFEVAARGGSGDIVRVNASKAAFFLAANAGMGPDGKLPEDDFSLQHNLAEDSRLSKPLLSRLDIIAVRPVPLDQVETLIERRIDKVLASEMQRKNLATIDIANRKAFVDSLIPFYDPETGDAREIMRRVEKEVQYQVARELIVPATGRDCDRLELTLRAR